MSYKYLDHMADIGLEVKADSLEQLFREGVQGLLSLFFETGNARPDKEVHCAAKESSIDDLFVALMNEVIFHIDQTGYIFHHCDVLEIEHEKEFTISIKLIGEPLDRTRHMVRTEVKAATYSGLSYVHKEGKHVIRCLFDL